MTIKDIAKLAGVSIATVSKIVNGKDQNINPETRNKVLKIVKDYNYTPYSSIKSFSTAKTFLIGVLLREASETADLLNGILTEAQLHGYGIVLFDSHNDPEAELKHITTLIKNKIDGVIWEPINSSSQLHEQHFTKQDIPIAYINTPELPQAYQINYEQMGYALAAKLLAYKHTKIACLGQADDLISLQVSEGFKKCLFDNQISYTPKMQLYSNESDYLTKLFSQNFTGVIGVHFSDALKLYEQMKKLLYDIPADLSLATIKKDVFQKNISYPSIAGITAPFCELGSYICQNLINECEKKETESAPFIFNTQYSFDHEDSIAIPPSLRSKKILVIGSINIDNTFNVDALPQSGKTTKILNSSITLGGKGANQSIGAARLGLEVSLIGKIGNDADSSFIIDTLENERVSTLGIKHDKSAQTGKAFIYLETSGESTITILSGANGNLNPSDITKRQNLFQNAGYTLLSTELTLPAIIEAAKISKQYDSKNILKPATLKSIPDELLEHIDILIPNRKEAAVLCPDLTAPEDQAQFFIEKGVEIVIITLGHNGCYLKTRNKSEYFPAADFAPVDTTGGADAFISALASYLIIGYSLEKTIQIATYAAGFCISRQGVVPSLIDKSTLETHIGQFDNKLLKE